MAEGRRGGQRVLQCVSSFQSGLVAVFLSMCVCKSVFVYVCEREGEREGRWMIVHTPTLLCFPPTSSRDCESLTDLLGDTHTCPHKEELLLLVTSPIVYLVLFTIISLAL